MLSQEELEKYIADLCSEMLTQEVCNGLLEKLHRNDSSQLMISHIAWNHIEAYSRILNNLQKLGLDCTKALFYHASGDYTYANFVSVQTEVNWLSTRFLRMGRINIAITADQKLTYYVDGKFYPINAKLLGLADEHYEIFKLACTSSLDEDGEEDWLKLNDNLCFPENKAEAEINRNALSRLSEYMLGKNHLSFFEAPVFHLIKYDPKAYISLIKTNINNLDFTTKILLVNHNRNSMEQLLRNPEDYFALLEILKVNSDMLYSIALKEVSYQVCAVLLERDPGQVIAVLAKIYCIDLLEYFIDMLEHYISRRLTHQDEQNSFLKYIEKISLFLTCLVAYLKEDLTLSLMMREKYVSFLDFVNNLCFSRYIKITDEDMIIPMFIDPITLIPLERMVCWEDGYFYDYETIRNLPILQSPMTMQPINFPIHLNVSLHQLLSKRILDPISDNPVQDPVIASDGFCYERRSFECMGEEKISPISRRILDDKARPCYPLKQWLEEAVVSPIVEVDQSSRKRPRI